MATVVAPIRIALQNILVATDFSACAQTALNYASALTRRSGGTLFTVNVLPHMPFVESEQPDPEKIRGIAEQRMAKMAGSEPFRGIKHREFIRDGEIGEALSALVRENHIDLIVVGTEGRTGLRKFLLGSVAEEIFRTAECPVLTLGPHVTMSGGILRHILFATDFGPESLHGLPYALSLAEEHRAHLTLLHVATGTGVILPEPQPGAMPASDPYVEVATGEKRLRALIPADAVLWHEPECLVQFGPAADTILRVAGEQTDMIILGVKRPALLTKHLGGGVAYRIICEAPCPVLSVDAPQMH
ncbi:MAG: universal stress protein [Terriglobales bacterium]